MGLKKKKHTKIMKDYKKAKSNHLEKLANKMLKDDERNELLKTKKIKGDFSTASSINSIASELDFKSGAKPPSSPTLVLSPRSFKTNFNL